jgi:ATP-dependent exoDNAse (exonuclease V) alpha subunit
MLSKNDFLLLFKEQLHYPPTNGQSEAMELLSEFVCKNVKNQLFILRGYAGTGKTTLVSALVQTLKMLDKKNVLLAPTGRAAKVFSVYSNQKAYTIHKHLYRVKMKDGMLDFSRRENKMSDTLFIVDEVSMLSAAIQSGTLFANKSLLEDLIEYVFEGENCKMIFIGDDAQLPPVHSTESPALMTDYLNKNFHLNTTSFQLTEVVRQALDSGILFNANILRNKILERDINFPVFSGNPFEDYTRINGSELEELLNTLYAKYDSDEIVVITRSNKRAYIFNNEIRKRILFRENQISTGDSIMAVKNNYYWVDSTSEIGFIANGDIMEILAINKIQEIYGFMFADVSVRLCDYPNFQNIDIKIIIDSLESEGPSLTGEKMSSLYQEVLLDYQNISNKRIRYLKMKNDPYLNALQIKFSYSLTCHKTQGGQWKIVLIDQGYIKEENIDVEYFRWLYTAITRASEKVFLINFDEKMFANPE